MDPTVIEYAAVALVAGAGLGWLTGTGAARRLRATIANRDARIATLSDCLDAANAELVQTGDRNSELRRENTAITAKFGRAEALNRALEPDAEIGRKAREQREANLARMQAANAARAAQKLANGDGSARKPRRTPAAATH